MFSVVTAEAFTASDASTNSAYDGGQWALGYNGGTGFGVWRQIGDEPNIAIDNGFAIYADGQLARSFEDDIVLGTGTFSAEALHGYADGFSGFALYGTDDAEIVRWGVTTAEDPDTGVSRTGFWYAIGTGGRVVYQFVDAAAEESILQTRLDYSLTWERADAGTALSLAVGAGGVNWATVRCLLEDAQVVSAIGFIASGTSHDSKPLRVDSLYVTGTPVPEPGCVALMIIGGVTLVARRRRRS